ncbi:uncharacterized protein LOC141643944 [Silene latifolia]|uniref:uncharacterized protein LOC141643944 n=1 Tax=Silene latifolia TaxID=37657 RepID=UPI003D775EDC
MAAITPFQTLALPSNHVPQQWRQSSLPLSSFSINRHCHSSCNSLTVRRQRTRLTNATRTPSSNNPNRNPQQFNEENEDEFDLVKKVPQIALWSLEGVYIIWLFLLPYAPGDPVWAISSETINSLLGLSLNFFFVLPLMNAVGIHVLEAPVLHPMFEGLFNFVMGWTLMFAPLLFTDLKNDRYKGSLDVLWGIQLFLTNTFLIPYMAIRLNKSNGNDYPRKLSQLGTVMTRGAYIVGLTGGLVCLISILWGLYGRGEGDFGSVSQRWEFLLSYIGSERSAYAFIWDIVLYTIFQPWLIGDNLVNVEESKVPAVNNLRFVPVIGLVAYLIFLKRDEELYTVDEQA